VDQLCDDVAPGARAGAKLAAHAAGRSGQLSQGGGVAGQFLERHAVRRSEGEIAYLHPQFVPVRDNRFDYTHPVDGSDPATDWKGLHTLASLPQAINPREGWAFNTNNEPWHAAGADSPVKAHFPRYMDQVGENERGRHALLLLTGKKGWTHESLRAAAFDSFLPGFARLLPVLMADYDHLPSGMRGGRLWRGRSRCCADGTGVGAGVDADDFGGVLGRYAMGSGGRQGTGGA
jgi:hypothetical protein